MTLIGSWLRFASFSEIKAEATRRGILKTDTIPPAIIYKEITGSELGDILPSKYILDDKEYWTNRYIRDTKYKLTSLSEIIRFLKWNMLNNENYIAQYYDCDNFSLQLAADSQVWTPGLAFGIFDVPGHSKNICVTHDSKVYEIEPQSDGISELKPTTQVVLYLV